MALECLFLTFGHPFAVGDQVVLPAMEVTILEMDGDFPTRLRFRWGRPLDDPVFRFLTWELGKLVPFEMPAVGETVLLPR